MKNLTAAQKPFLKKKKILIVEDDLLMRQLLKFRLSNRGFEVTTAKNEKEFWYAAFKENPNLILLDLWLGNKIGANIYDRLIDFGFDPHVPVIFITGYIQTGSPTPIHVRKNQIFLSKPFDFEQLMLSVDKLLSQNSERKPDAHPLHMSEQNRELSESALRS